MHARRDALAHRFISRTLPETAAWPPSLQIALHELAFVAIPESVLDLEANAAMAWARRWRSEIEAASMIDSTTPEWLSALASEWLAARPAAGDADTPASDAELARLTDLVSRLGPLALQLPWRNEPRGKA